VPPAWGIAALSLPVTLIAYRPAKGAWFALLHFRGFMPREGELTRLQRGASAP
jgi:hypothetical protein